MASSAENYIEKYQLFITKNPLLASEIEVGLKWMSYIAAGRFTQSPVITELIHCVSNLLTLLNDSILRKAAGIQVHINVTVDKLQTYLAIIEYSEVFAEVAARHIVGRRGKWLIIISLQFVKTVIRMLLLFKYDQGIQHWPPIPPLNRRHDIPQLCASARENHSPDASSNVEVAFTLKRSGRVIRTLEAAPPLSSRSWKLPKPEENSIMLIRSNPTKLSGHCVTGEILHICRPLIHLLSVGAFGEFSWKPWIIAFGMDVTSLQMVKAKGFTRAEKLEINRRALSLLIYLLRSPFYDHYSKLHILSTLKNIADNLPGSGIILRPLMEYIPEWQQIYFYVWAL